MFNVDFLGLLFLISFRARGGFVGSRIGVLTIEHLPTCIQHAGKLTGRWRLKTGPVLKMYFNFLCLVNMSLFCALARCGQAAGPARRLGAHRSGFFRSWTGRVSPKWLMQRQEPRRQLQLGRMFHLANRFLGGFIEDTDKNLSPRLMDF